jgi:hypothetical protein
MNLTGRRFQHLTAVKRAENKNGKTYWLFRCDCGNEVEKRTRNVLRNTKNSCGCINPRFIDRTGEKFGKLLVKKFVEIRNSRSYYFCVCDCGTEKQVAIDNLTSGGTLSCGCYLRLRTRRKYTTKDGYVRAYQPHHPYADFLGLLWKKR